MNKIINWGIIGLGNAAINLAQNFKLVKNARLLAVASKTKTKRNFFHKKFRIKKNNIYKNYEDILNNRNIDIIFIALPHTMHKEWCIKSAKCNKNILVEKPAALSKIDLKKIIKCTKLNNVFFTEGLAFRFHPFFNQIYSEIKKINKKNIISIKATFGADAIGGRKFFGIRLKKPKINKRLFNPNLAGGAIWDTGCYPVSAIRQIISFINDDKYIKPKILSIKKKIGSTFVDEHSSLQLKFNNIKTYIETSIDRPLKNNIEIELSNGKIVINNPWHPSKFSFIKLIINNEKKIIKCEKKINVYQKQIEIISSMLNKGCKELKYPLPSYDDISDNVEILEKWANK